MSGNGKAVQVVVLEGGAEHDVLEVVSVEGDTAFVRTPMLFEIGETLLLRITDAGGSNERPARVVNHSSHASGRVTELALD